MESDVDKLNQLASKLFADLNEQRQNGYVLCKCEECDHSDAPVWERSNFCSRGTSSLHIKNQRIRNKQPPARKGSNDQQSFWKPEEVVALFRQEALAALQEDAAADRQSSPGTVDTCSWSPIAHVCRESTCAFAAGEDASVEDMQQSDTDMANAQEDTIEMEDEPCHSPLQQQEAEQPGSHSSEPPRQPAWDPPRAAHISEDMGLLGFFADTGQQTQPPREELEKLLPGRDGSVLIRASPLTIAEALDGGLYLPVSLLFDNSRQLSGFQFKLHLCCRIVRH